MSKLKDEALWIAAVVISRVAWNPEDECWWYDERTDGQRERLKTELLRLADELHDLSGMLRN